MQRQADTKEAVAEILFIIQYLQMNLQLKQNKPV